MKLGLSNEQKEKIKAILLGVKVNAGHMCVYNNKRTTDWIGYISDFYLDKERKQFYVKIDKKNSFETVGFKKFLDMIHNSDKYKVNSRKLKDLSSAYCKSVSNDNIQYFKKYLDSIGELTFNIDDCDILDDEIEWLDKHVVRIDAMFPPKYLKDFLKNFDTENYRLTNTGWAYGFTLYFNSMENIPESLLEKTNAAGNKLDYDEKRMSNTSYIWHLVKSYPDKFKFGKREISK